MHIIRTSLFNLTFQMCLGCDPKVFRSHLISSFLLYSVSTPSPGEYIKLTGWNFSWKDNFVLKISAFPRNNLITILCKFYIWMTRTSIWKVLFFLFSKLSLKSGLDMGQEDICGMKTNGLHSFACLETSNRQPFDKI